MHHTHDDVLSHIGKGAITQRCAAVHHTSATSLPEIRHASHHLCVRQPPSAHYAHDDRLLPSIHSRSSEAGPSADRCQSPTCFCNADCDVLRLPQMQHPHPHITQATKGELKRSLHPPTMHGVSCTCLSRDVRCAQYTCESMLSCPAALRFLASFALSPAAFLCLSALSPVGREPPRCPRYDTRHTICATHSHPQHTTHMMIDFYHPYTLVLPRLAQCGQMPKSNMLLQC